jgi:hypothetical protein
VSAVAGREDGREDEGVRVPLPRNGEGVRPVTFAYEERDDEVGAGVDAERHYTFRPCHCRRCLAEDEAST